MRKVLFRRPLPDGENWSELMQEGLFHQWITSAHPGMREYNTVVALIELPDGTVEEVLPSNLKFVKEAKTGVDLIAQERREQIKKHGRTIDHDAQVNDNGQLVDATLQLLAVEYNEGWDSYNTPDGWDKEIMAKMIGKSKKERLIIAGALIAAEIDRLHHV